MGQAAPPEAMAAGDGGAGSEVGSRHRKPKLNPEKDPNEWLGTGR